jgi:hypothetical protein
MSGNVGTGVPGRLWRDGMDQSVHTWRLVAGLGMRLACWGVVGAVTLHLHCCFVGSAELGVKFIF